MQAFPVQQLPTDILRMVFQSIIDDEAATFQPLLDSAGHSLTAIAPLVLVCRLWKDLVYNTPSLWAVIALNMAEPEAKMQRRCDRLSARSKEAPVDLYILNLHLPHEGWIHAPLYGCLTCSCRQNPISISLKHIQNIRKLYVSTLSIEALYSLEPNLPRIERIRDKTFAFRKCEGVSTSWVSPLMTYDCERFGGMVGLTKLSIGEVGLFSFPFAGKHPLLPSLQTLELASTQTRFFPIPWLVKLLSHCPRLELLDYTEARLLDHFTIDFPPIVLRYLRTIICHGSYISLHIFTPRIIETPSLSEYRCKAWLTSWNASAGDFLASIMTITSITLFVYEYDNYALALDEATQLEHLRLIARKSGVGEFLRSLVEPLDGIHKGNRLCCSQSLKTVFVECLLLDAVWFQRLARIRCIPSKDPRATESGCIPLEVLQLRMPGTLLGAGAAWLESTQEWRDAILTKGCVNGGYNLYELRWK